MSELESLVSQLSPEARAQWDALVEADERYRAGHASLTSIQSNPYLNALERKIDEFDNWKDYDAEWMPQPPEPTQTERADVAFRAARERELSADIIQASKDKQAPAKWLDERGLLDGLWRALWAERHARGE